MSLLDVLANQHAAMMPEEYKHRSVDEMKQRVLDIKRAFGSKLFIPGHHYQKDEVIQFADATGDSLQLAQIAADNQEAEYIVFCGVHFMAETADMLSNKNQKVLLPDMRAGCSMADMANMKQTDIAWEQLTDLFGDTILPLTYVNSTADIKAFVGKHGGATVTSSNAKKVLEWALTQKERILFLPDQHLGRNTAFDLGISLEEMAVWDQIEEKLITDQPLSRIKMILWKAIALSMRNLRCGILKKREKETVTFKSLSIQNARMKSSGLLILPVQRNLLLIRLRKRQQEASGRLEQR